MQRHGTAGMAMCPQRRRGINAADLHGFGQNRVKPRHRHRRVAFVQNTVRICCDITCDILDRCHGKILARHGQYLFQIGTPPANHQRARRIFQGDETKIADLGHDQIIQHQGIKRFCIVQRGIAGQRQGCVQGGDLRGIAQYPLHALALQNNLHIPPRGGGALWKHHPLF